MSVIDPYAPNHIKIHPTDYVEATISNSAYATQHNRRNTSYYYDSQTETAYPSSKKTIEPIDWNEVIPDSTPPEPIPRELKPYNLALGSYTHQIITGEKSPTKPTKINPYTLPAGITYTDILETLAETHSDMDPLDEIDVATIDDDASYSKLRRQMFDDYSTAKQLWQTALEELNICVLQREPKLTHEINEKLGYGCEPDTIATANPPTAEAGLYAAEIKVTARNITEKDKCQAEMQRRAIQPIIETDAEAHAMVIQLDPIEEEYSYATSQDGMWYTDDYRYWFDRRLRHRYREEGIAILMNEIAREHV